MPDTRGDVLCPTCGQWTPPAPFCTECGAALQLGVQEPGEVFAVPTWARGRPARITMGQRGGTIRARARGPGGARRRGWSSGARPPLDNLTEPEPPAAA